MRFNFYKEYRFSLVVLALIICVSLLFYLFASMFTSMGYKGLSSETLAVNISVSKRQIVILDAGHGGEDPGACSNGLIEKDLNLEITLIINEILKINGFKTILTREDDRLLYNSGEENRKKYYDIRNREKIANSYENAIFISIHFNKFPAEYCKGLQAFYNSENLEGKKLSESIQNNAKLLQPYNNRVAADGRETIYLLEKLKHPATLVECGFISNIEESDRLKDENYKISLSMTIYCGIADFLEN